MKVVYELSSKQRAPALAEPSKSEADAQMLAATHAPSDSIGGDGPGDASGIGDHVGVDGSGDASGVGVGDD